MKQKIKVIYIFLLFYGFSTLFASTNKSNQLVAEAWQAWAENDQQLVEQKLMAAIAEDQNNTRAYLGLSFLYNLQYKFDQAWTTYEKVLQIEKNMYPYIFAAWDTNKMRDENDTMKSHTVALLEKLSQRGDNAGILKAMTNEVLGKYYQQKGDFSKAKRYYENMNSVTEWTVIGPFDNISASGFDKVFPPELEYDVTKTYAGKNGVPASWFKVEKIRNDYWIDFRRYFAFFESVYYANTFVYSPKKQSIQIRIGTSGSLKAFLNDALIVQAFDELNNGLDTYVVETELQEGWNRLLIKCGYSEIKQCNFMVRLTDAEGEVLVGLKVSTESQPYESTSSIPVKVIENFAEAFFKQKIKAHPERLENYLLLADCLLRNDKANAAELVLRDAIQLSPNCALLYHHILEAYRRGHKYDELATTVEKIYTLDNLVPYVLEYKILTYFDNQEVGRAEELLKKLEKLLPQSALVYELYLELYDKKNLVDKMRETSSQAYHQFPANWTFAYWEAYNSIQLTQKCNRAIEIIAAFLKRKLTLDALTTLADVYLRSANIEKWQEMYQKALAVDPAATGFYFQMAKTYFALQDYDHAEEAIKKGLAICPNSPHFWFQLGEIYRVKNKIDLARQAFHEVLNYEPTSYKAREVLRELEGKKSIFAQFENVDIDSLRAAASDSDEFAENGAVILLHDAKSVVYGRGASESIEEILVKVFNNRGIDAVKEYWISYNAYSQELIVEKAVVIKSDGSEINGDIDVNHIVFKSLEANDFIYLKWKLKNFYSGKLANHFWDTFYFNAYYPAKLIRYALLVPNNFNFNYQTQNMQIQPTKKQTEKGILYQWSLNDEPAIAYEYYMPGLADVGKMLYISSIEDWGYIVGWYSDLARTKTRSSYEIKELVHELLKGKENNSEEAKIKTIYNFITENIRYSSVSFRQSSFIPQKARDVLVNKIGDCKDMSTLTIAMLREAGIKAYYVLLNTKDRGRNANILPSIAFNHCIVAVATTEGWLYLDPTAYNYPAGSLPEMDVDGFSLLIKSDVKSPEYLSGNGVMPNNIFRQSKVEIRPDKSMFIQSKGLRTGALSASMRNSYRHIGQKEKEITLTELLSKEFPNIKLTKFEIENLDDLRPEVSFTYHFEVPNYVNESGQFLFLKIPWTDGLDGNRALSYEQRKYPYNYWPWADTLVQEIEIQIPAGYEPLDLVKEVKFTSAIADYSISYSFSPGVLKGRRKFVNKKSVVLPEEYAEFKKYYNRVVNEDSKQILFKKIELALGMIEK